MDEREQKVIEEICEAVKEATREKKAEMLAFLEGYLFALNKGA